MVMVPSDSSVKSSSASGGSLESVPKKHLGLKGPTDLRVSKDTRGSIDSVDTLDPIDTLKQYTLGTPRT